MFNSTYLLTVCFHMYAEVRGVGLMRAMEFDGGLVPPGQIPVRKRARGSSHVYVWAHSSAHRNGGAVLQVVRSAQATSTTYIRFRNDSFHTLASDNRGGTNDV